MQMQSLQSRLLEWQTQHGRSIRVGIAGTGEFGAGVVGQVTQMPGVEVTVVADLNAEKARSVLTQAGIPDEAITHASSPSAVQRGIEAGQRVVVEDGLLIPESQVDVVVDITGEPDFGARFASAAIANHQHVVMVNLEADAVVGPILRRMADRAGVVYTEADGDQPSLICGMVDWARALGLEVVTAGKWTRLYTNAAATGHHVTDSYLDGSKNQIEMTCVANMTGLLPDVPGLRAPSLSLTEIPRTLIPADDGGILAHRGVIDVVNCFSPDGKTEVEPLLQGGVFIIVSSADQRMIPMIRGKGVLTDPTGQYALLYRPYHLIGLEAPTSILRAVLYHEPTGAPRPQPVADTVAVAKRPLLAGEQLLGIGGDTHKGIIYEAGAARVGNYLPYSLASGVRVIQDVPAGTPITYDMLEAPGADYVWTLRAEQDRATLKE